MSKLIINIPFDSTDETMDLIKLCAIYFRTTNIICPMYDEKSPYFNEEKIDSLSILLDNDAISIDYEWFLGPNQNCREFIMDKWDCYVDNNDEIFDLMYLPGINEYLNECTPNMNDIGAELIMQAFLNEVTIREFQIAIAYSMLLNGKNVATNYSGIWDFYKKISKNKKIVTNAAITLHTIPIFIPQYKNLNYEDICEIRIKAEDELYQLQDYIDTLSKEYNSQIDIESIKSYVDRKVNPAIKAFERKLKSSKIKVFSKLLNEIKNPLSYAPLLTTFFSNIPPPILLALSLGIIGAEVTIDYIKNKEDMKDNEPLIFSTKLKSFR